jgi:hypothetical protein
MTGQRDPVEAIALSINVRQTPGRRRGDRLYRSRAVNQLDVRRPFADLLLRGLPALASAKRGADERRDRDVRSKYAFGTR